MSELRQLPSVEQLLQTRQAAEDITAYGRPLTLEALRQTLAVVRQAFSEQDGLPGEQAILQQARDRLREWTAPSLYPVINATGVVLHTNLGRAPLSQAAIQAIQATSQGYSNLEYDLGKGQRGSRLLHAESLLTHLTGAEAALVVNNNAAALLLILSALASRKRAVISRTQLVEVGGGFRIPEVMAQSGARLVEIGATNRVHLSDYENALAEPTALVLRAHHSNFRIIGFTSEPGLAELVALAHRHGLPLVHDLGSGSLMDTARYGLSHEPTVQESIKAGVDLVCFSGDKLLGGPQAGIIVGRLDLVAKLRKHPLARAIRADKLCLAALSATLLHYLKDEADREIPVWRMISETPESLRARAARWAGELGEGEVIEGQSAFGGGSLPEENLPTFLLALDVAQPNRFLSRLRQASPPIVARIQDDRVVLDPRTVLPGEENALLIGLKTALSALRPEKKRLITGTL